jgi:hypothetical protein
MIIEILNKNTAEIRRGMTKVGNEKDSYTSQVVGRVRLWGAEMIFLIYPKCYLIASVIRAGGKMEQDLSSKSYRSLIN